MKGIENLQKKKTKTSGKHCIARGKIRETVRKSRDEKFVTESNDLRRGYTDKIKQVAGLDLDI